MGRIGTDELRDAVLDEGTFISWDNTPLMVPTNASYARELADARATTGRDESVLTGEGRVFGRRVAVVVCEFEFLGGSIGVAAAERITDEESDGLRALLDSIGPDPAAEELVANDLEFHRRIVACSGNSVLSSLLESMSGPTTRARVWRGLTQTGARAQTLAEHRAILDALAAHEPEVARSWATVHIAGVEQWLASMT